MFNRDKLPGLPGSSPRPLPRDGYARPQQQKPPPQRLPAYDTRMSGGYEEQPPQGYGQRMPTRGPPPGGAGGGRPVLLRPIKSPGGNAYAFGNLYAFVFY